MNESIYQKLKKNIDSNLEKNSFTTFKDAIVGVKPEKDRENLRDMITGEIKKDCHSRLVNEYRISNIFKTTKDEITDFEIRKK